LRLRIANRVPRRLFALRHGTLIDRAKYRYGYLTHDGSHGTCRRWRAFGFVETEHTIPYRTHERKYPDPVLLGLGAGRKRARIQVGEVGIQARRILEIHVDWGRIGGVGVWGLGCVLVAHAFCAMAWVARCPSRVCDGRAPRRAG
jgi:hypothetical protein